MEAANIVANPGKTLQQLSTRHLLLLMCLVCLLQTAWCLSSCLSCVIQSRCKLGIRRLLHAPIGRGKPAQCAFSTGRGGWKMGVQKTLRSNHKRREVETPSGGGGGTRPSPQRKKPILRGLGLKATFPAKPLSNTLNPKPGTTTTGTRPTTPCVPRRTVGAAGGRRPWTKSAL